MITELMPGPLLGALGYTGKESGILVCGGGEQETQNTGEVYGVLTLLMLTKTELNKEMARTRERASPLERRGGGEPWRAGGISSRGSLCRDPWAENARCSWDSSAASERG